MRPLREAALERVRSGECTLEEVDRVLGGAEEDSPVADPASSHILLVDDDGVTRAIARKVLEKHGFRVSEAGDGVAALEKLRGTGDIKLMVLDLDMPRLGGAEVLDQVRKSVATAGLPVIVLTGSNNGAAEIELLDRGADDFVRKPIDAARFVTRVRAALRRAGG
jgi:DNA-binding response OmpR family regulator